MHYKIITSDWFSTIDPVCDGAVLGAVLVDIGGNKVKGYFNAVIGGFIQELDEQRIAATGAKLLPPIVRAMFPEHTKGKEVVY